MTYAIPTTLRCHRCSGRMLNDDGELRCLLCGRTPDTPEPVAEVREKTVCAKCGYTFRYRRQGTRAICQGCINRARNARGTMPELTLARAQAGRRGRERGVLMRCSTCGGEGTLSGLIKPTRGACYLGTLPCPACEGTGAMGEVQARQMAEGQRRRRDRISRGVSLKEEALRLGISPAALSDLEHGRV